MNRKSYVYILANKRNGTLYVGVTSNLIKRVWQHKKDLANGFTKNILSVNLCIMKRMKIYEVLFTEKNVDPAVKPREDDFAIFNTTHIF